MKQAKLLGVIVTDDLRWDENTSYIMKNAYARMELLHKIAEFGASIEEKKNIYYLYIRSVLEQACVVWNSGLSMENIEDLERVQISSVKIILGNKYEDYISSHESLSIDTLADRRHTLCVKFALKTLKHEKMMTIFIKNGKIHNMKPRKTQKI